ncbi:hypothetical protein N9W41_00085 [bacterium]|nr:hypothetical protein [bacterium]
MAQAQSQLSSLYLDLFSRFIKSTNEKIKAFDDISDLEGASEEVLTELIELLNLYIKNCSGELNATANKAMFFAALKNYKLNFLKSSDLEFVDFDNVLEIYRLSDFKQVYRNFAFFKLSTFSLLDLVQRPLNELFSRNEEVEKSVIDLFMSSSSLTRAQKITNVSKHLIKEKFRNHRQVFMYEPNYITPLSDGTSPEGRPTHILLSGNVQMYEMKPLVAESQSENQIQI